jgi:O-antigen ligase
MRDFCMTPAPALSTADGTQIGWQAASRPAATNASGTTFRLVLLYMVLEYARPQATIPILAALHLPALVTLLIAAALAFSRQPKMTDRQSWLFAAFLGLLVFHVPIAANDHWAFHLARGMVTTFVAYLGLVMSVRTVSRFETLCTAWVWIHVYLAVMGIAQNGFGVGGFLWDENDFGLTLNMIIPFAFFLAMSEAPGYKRALLIAVTALFVVGALHTFSRGTFIGLVAVVLYCWLRSPQKLRSALVIGLLLICLLMFAPKNYWTEMQTITQEGASAGTGEQRVYLWRVGWRMFLSNPLIGVGQGNFPFSFRTYEITAGFPDGLRGRSMAGHAAHSFYVTLAAEQGLAGLAIVGMIVFYFRKDVLAMRRRAAPGGRPQSKETERIFILSYALTGSLIGFLASGMFISVLYYPNLWLLVGFSVALKHATRVPSESPQSREDAPHMIPKELPPAGDQDPGRQRPLATWR